MTKPYAVLTLALLALLSLPVEAARLDTPKPGTAPVTNVTISEKGDAVTMTFYVDTSYNFCTLKSVTIWESYEEPMKAIKPTIVKGVTWKITFKLTKAQVATAKVHLSYTMPEKGAEHSVHLNQVNLNVADFYKHYKAKQKK